MVNSFLPVGLAGDVFGGSRRAWGWRSFSAKFSSCGRGAVVLVETANAKLRLFRVPDLLSAAFVLAAHGLVVHVPFSLTMNTPAYN